MQREEPSDEPSESESPAGETSAAASGSPGEKGPILYEFTGRNSLDQFVVWMILIHALYLGLEPYRWRCGLFPATCLVIIVGLRGSIVVTPSRVRITKKWFFVPYWRFTANEIENVWLEGEWGREGDSMGIVVQLGKREVSLGSSGTMNQLLRGLYSLTATARRYREEPLAKPWSPAPEQFHTEDELVDLVVKPTGTQRTSP